ncbi:hypothetical protein KM043_014716 [Ampulex compressa]|nr:hypothetical protein KM043_014716 [Ampulex compressa]
MALKANPPARGSKAEGIQKLMKASRLVGSELYGERRTCGNPSWAPNEVTNALRAFFFLALCQEARSTRGKPFVGSSLCAALQNDFLERDNRTALIPPDPNSFDGLPAMRANGRRGSLPREFPANEGIQSLNAVRSALEATLHWPSTTAEFLRDQGYAFCESLVEMAGPGRRAFEVATLGTRILDTPLRRNAGPSSIIALGLDK